MFSLLRQHCMLTAKGLSRSKVGKTAVMVCEVIPFKIFFTLLATMTDTVKFSGVGDDGM